MKKTCNVCGEFKEYHGKGMCRKCYDKRYYTINKPEIAKRMKKWQAEHKEERAEYRTGHKEERVEYRDKNKKKIAEQVEKYSKKYCQTPNGKLAIKRGRMNRRAYGRVRKGDISKLLNENIFKYGIITCEKCKKECEDNYHIDHIKPVSKEGNNDYGNLQILCAHCNLTKRVDIVDYRQNIENNQMFLGGKS